MLQPNTNVSESIDLSERVIKQLQNEIIFLSEELRNKNNTIKCALVRHQNLMRMFFQIQSVLGIKNEIMIASC